MGFVGIDQPGRFAGAARYSEVVMLVTQTALVRYPDKCRYEPHPCWCLPQIIYGNTNPDLAFAANTSALVIMPLASKSNR